MCVSSCAGWSAPRAAPGLQTESPNAARTAKGPAGRSDPCGHTHSSCRDLFETICLIESRQFVYEKEKEPGASATEDSRPVADVPGSDSPRGAQEQILPTFSAIVEQPCASAAGDGSVDRQPGGQKLWRPQKACGRRGRCNEKPGSSFSYLAACPACWAWAEHRGL